MLDEGLIACDSLEISPWTVTAERPDSDPSSQRVTSPGPLPPSACREPSYLAGGSHRRGGLPRPNTASSNFGHVTRFDVEAVVPS